MKKNSKQNNHLELETLSLKSAIVKQLKQGESQT